MSTPHLHYKNPIRGITSELMSAMSSLNMPPEPITPSIDAAGYLSEVDHWAKHSIEHLYAAHQQIVELHKKIQELHTQTFKIFKKNHNDEDVEKLMDLVSDLYF